MTHPYIKMIVALDSNNAIGNKNTIPWYLPEDLKRFKSLTENNIVVMGRKTYESLPNKPLKNRLNIVLTKDPHFNPGDDSVLVFHDIVAVIDYLRTLEDDRTTFIIGGKEIYSAFLSMADELLVTEVDIEVDEVDTHFPFISDKIWKRMDTESHVSSNGIVYHYVTYRRY